MARKITELRHAIAFEQNHSKKWILTRYLNIAFFGDQSHGIQAAARHYFSVDAKDLNVQQAAMLAGLVKNPNVYNPTASKDAALSRRNVVLDQMQKYGYLSRGELADLKAKPLGLKRSPNRNGCISSVAPIFCDYVYNFLMADPALGETKQGRENLLRNGGLTISTTMDPPIPGGRGSLHVDVCRTQRPSRWCPRQRATGHRARACRLAIAPTGTRSPQGRDHLELRDSHRVGQGSALPGWVDLQGFRAGCSPRRGH
ncbi:MAG: transglycosylase domain-containing protein [Marmoricola sp.]